MGYFLISIIREAIWIYIVIIIANAILSWFVGGIRNIMVRRIYWTTNALVDPVLAPVRRLLNPMMRSFGIDISPFIVIILLQILRGMLRSLL